MHLYWRLSNEKSSSPIFIKVLLIPVIFQSQIMTSFFDSLAAYEFLWGCKFIFAHTKMLIISDPTCDHTGIRVLQFQISILQMTLTLD